MPILAPEPMMFPDDLLIANPANDSKGSWWALQTLARREKVLMRRLRAMQIPHYCPLIRHRNRHTTGRVRISQLPLFAGYVFMCGGEAERYRALTSNCISNCLPVTNVSRFVFELRQIHRLIEIDAPLTVEARIKPGRRVRVRAGSMAGLEGTVVKRRGKDWLVVAVEFLLSGASILLEDYQVEAI